jgi:arabinofuranan 3-O-arabinosyltransferase
MVIDTGDALAGLPAGQTPPVTVLQWTQATRRVAVHATTTSYLVVNENANAGWRATLNGRTLRPARLDGWRQAWVIPSGANGTVTMTYTPDRVYQAAILVGLNLMVILLIVACWPARPRAPRDPRPPGAVRPRWLRVAALAVLGAAVGLWTGGLVGAAVGAAAVAAGAVAAGAFASRRALLPWIAASAMLTGSICVAADAGSSIVGGVVPQLLGLIVLGVLSSVIVEEFRGYDPGIPPRSQQEVPPHQVRSWMIWAWGRCRWARR